MLKYYNFDIVFAEIPDEVTMAINITNCPNRCVGCHSPHLQEDIGKVLDETELARLINAYDYDITCVCFMGGDREPNSVLQLAEFVKKTFPKVKTAWYSGKSSLPQNFDLPQFDYIKLGGYDSSKGPLNKPTTNQKLYKICSGEMVDITDRFWKK
ncbi:MAG: anaerobic ribonucleoside-triphosphate reductase activating protein [Bacteroidales bacterium]|nr:anaerobic ribonucleoside-triphosphate reductase activating protein [Bacteroidales bacterium]